ncbi:lipoprotein [Carnobacterium jeotgali]
MIKMKKILTLLGAVVVLAGCDLRRNNF